MDEIWRLLPGELRDKLNTLPDGTREELEEIRLRTNRPVELFVKQQSYFITSRGQLSKNPQQGWIFSRDLATKVLNVISDHSLYALEDQLKNGYITVNGGHRVGMAGKVVTKDGRVEGIKEIVSFNIRVAREKKGVAHPLIPYLIDSGRWLHTLIVSPPQCGKTTLLRDLARLISYGNRYISGKKVGIVDERSEIAGCWRGIPQKDVGIRTDVLDACPKAEGMMMMIRSMSPDVIVTDELGRDEDVRAVREVLNAGVILMTSAHGKDLEDLRKRPILSRMIDMEIFERFVVLSRRRGAGTVEGIFDKNGRSLLKESISC